jgi:hypothetical protein
VGFLKSKHTIFAAVFTIINAVLFTKIDNFNLFKWINQLDNTLGYVLSIVLIAVALAVITWGNIRQLKEKDRIIAQKDAMFRELEQKIDHTKYDIKSEDIKTLSECKDIQKDLYGIYCNIQSCADYQSFLISNLQTIASNIEKLLSKEYDKKICVNIKLVTNEKYYFQTVARGNNNRENRDRGNDYDSCSHDMSKDSAIDCVIRMGKDHFICGDTLAHKSKYPEFQLCTNNWEVKIHSTLVLPIRLEILHVNERRKKRRQQQTPLLGLFCIDCREEIMEWDCNNDTITTCFAYNLCSTLSYSLGTLLNEYMKRMRMQNTKGQAGVPMDNS